MTDDPVTVPDFVPTSIEEQHQEMARQQVRDSRSPRSAPPAPHPEPQDAAVQTRATAQEVTGTRSNPRWLDQLSGSEVGLATAAIVVGLLGVTALTVFWTWLAMSEDPMWWWFTPVGAGLSVALAIAAVALNQYRQKLTAATVPPSE